MMARRPAVMARLPGFLGANFGEDDSHAGDSRYSFCAEERADSVG
jgi:hypothetical protein